MKKVTSKQNIAIIILSVLLLISIGFGVTYSYFNGRSGDLTNTGKVTMATLAVDFDYDGKGEIDPTTGQTTPFTLHSKGTEVVPGAPLSNVALEIKNTSPVDTYMAVVYSLQIIKTETDAQGNQVETIVNAPAEMEAMDIQSSSVGDGWRKQLIKCADGKSLVCLLVFMGDNGNGNGIFKHTTPDQKSLVLDAECLKVPESWDNNMQGKTVTLTFTAYVIQAEAMTNAYPNLADSNVEDRARAIADMFVKEFNLDKTSAPAEPTPGE